VSKKRDKNYSHTRRKKFPREGERFTTKAPSISPFGGVKHEKEKYLQRPPAATFGGVMNAKGHSIKAA